MNLIWLDMEMSGLEPPTDRVLEIGMLITDNQLNIIAELPGIAVYQPDSVLNGMDEWNTKQHNASGLVQRVKSSRFDTQAVEQQALDFVKRYVAPHTSPMCGSTICQDRRFMEYHMPKLEAYFTPDNLDASTIKTLALCWAPHLIDEDKKVESKHLALDDIRDSVELLDYFRKHFFQKN